MRVKDAILESSTGVYINGSTLYLFDKLADATTEHTVTGGTSGGWTTVSSTLRCGSADGYTVFMKATGSHNSGDSFEITPAMLAAESNSIYVTFDGTDYTPYKVKVKDIDADADAYTSTNSTDYVTTLTSTFYGSTGSTAWAVGADGELEVELTLAPNSSGDAKGEAMYVAINLADDSNINDWDKDSVIVKWNGAVLSEASLSDNEKSALSSYELVFKS